MQWGAGSLTVCTEPGSRCQCPDSCLAAGVCCCLHPCPWLHPEGHLATPRKVQTHTLAPSQHALPATLRAPGTCLTRALRGAFFCLSWSSPFLFTSFLQCSLLLDPQPLL